MEGKRTRSLAGLILSLPCRFVDVGMRKIGANREKKQEEEKKGKKAKIDRASRYCSLTLTGI